MPKIYSGSEVADLVDNLDEDQLATLGRMMNKLDRITVGANKDNQGTNWDEDELDLIGQFHNLEAIEADEQGFEPEGEDEEDNENQAAQV